MMAFAGFLASEMRTTALILNIAAAGYATWRLHRSRLIDWRLLSQVGTPSLPMAFLGGLGTLAGTPYFVLTGLLLIIAAVLTVMKRKDAVGESRMPLRWPVLVGGATVGFLSGVTGVGGACFSPPCSSSWAGLRPDRQPACPPRSSCSTRCWD